VSHARGGAYFHLVEEPRLDGEPIVRRDGIVSCGVRAVRAVGDEGSNPHAVCRVIPLGGHIPAGLLIIALVSFIRLYFGTARAWLFWLVVGLRGLVLILNFLSPASFHFSEITALRPLEFLGETVVVPEGVSTPWVRLGEGSMLIAMVFVADASISLWRRGNARDRRRAVFVGGSVLLCIGVAIVIAIPSHTGLLPVPRCLSLFFALIMLAMAYELGHDLIHAGQLARDLREERAPD